MFWRHCSEAADVSFPNERVDLVSLAIYCDMRAQSQNYGVRRNIHYEVTTRYTRNGVIKRAFVAMQLSVTIT
jgi:hypothetical protein